MCITCIEILELIGFIKREERQDTVYVLLTVTPTPIPVPFDNSKSVRCFQSKSGIYRTPVQSVKQLSVLSEVGAGSRPLPTAQQLLELVTKTIFSSIRNLILRGGYETESGGAMSF